MNTRPPRSSKARAIANPIPRVAPVTTAVLPFMLLMRIPSVRLTAGLLHKGISEPASQPIYEGNRQPNHIVVIPSDLFDEQPAEPLNPVSSGLIHWLSGGDVPFDLSFRQPSEFD